jgi:hypothetical protein
MAITMRQFLVEKRKWRKGKQAPWTIINGHDDPRPLLVEGKRNGSRTGGRRKKWQQRPAIEHN